MTESTQPPADEEGAGPDAAGATPGWSGPEPAPGTEQASTDSRGSGPEWLGQLQRMIDDIATQAAPTIRQIGAKAAELAAVAGEKAGPFAHRAAEATETAGIKLAERSRQLAEELKRDLPPAGTPGPGSTAPDETEAGEPDPTHGQENGA